MTPGLVSVIMPVYNGADYLARAVDCVLKQTYPSVELVAVNDGSTDVSAEVLAGFQDARIRVFHQENSGSVGYVRNVCMSRAEGEYFAFLDQDDRWQPEKLARQVAAMQESEAIGLVHTDASHYYEAASAYGPPLNPLLARRQCVGKCYETLLMANAICNSSVLVRRQAIDHVGKCDLQIPGNTVQDYDLWLRIAERFELAYLPEPLTIYSVHSTQGLWNRRKMLHAELDLLLRVRDEAWWRQEPARRARIAEVYDELAVAHYEHGDYKDARDYLRLAAQFNPSRRTRARYLLSLLPNWFIGTLRGVKSGLSSETRKAPSPSR